MRALKYRINLIRTSIDTVLREKRNERFSVCLPERLVAAVDQCASMSDTTRNDFINILIAREAALQGILGVNSCDFDALENAIRRALCITRSLRSRDGRRKCA